MIHITHVFIQIVEKEKCYYVKVWKILFAFWAIKCLSFNNIYYNEIGLSEIMV